MTQSQKTVLKETAVVLAGETICVAVMLGIYALLGYFSNKVLLGAVVGGALSSLNFFFMALIATLAADKAQAQDVEGGQKLIKGAYPVRLLCLAAILFAFGKSGIVDILAMVLPLLFIRPIITIAEFFRRGERDG